MRTIDALIFVFACAFTVAWYLRDRARTISERDRWHLIGFLAVLLQLEAERAKRRAEIQAEIEKTKKDPE